MSALKAGMQAPDFTLPSSDGGNVTLSELGGSAVVLFFYPKDNTSGCTIEARDFTARAKAFSDAGVKVFGISKDSLKSHDNFVARQELGIPLLSDADSDVCERFGVWQEKSMYGRKFMGIVRTTVLIDREGKIAEVWPKVKVADHAEQVLQRALTL